MYVLTAAYAALGDVVEPSPKTGIGINQIQALWDGAIGLIVLFLTDLITHRLASPKTKALCMTLLTAAGTYLATVQLVNFSWPDFATNFMLALLAASSAFFGVLKPANVVGEDGLINKVLPGTLGVIGKDDPAPDEDQPAPEDFPLDATEEERQGGNSVIGVLCTIAGLVLLIIGAVDIIHDATDSAVSWGGIVMAAIGVGLLAVGTGRANRNNLL